MGKITWKNSSHLWKRDAVGRNCLAPAFLKEIHMDLNDSKSKKEIVVNRFSILFNALIPILLFGWLLLFSPVHLKVIRMCGICWMFSFNGQFIHSTVLRTAINLYCSVGSQQSSRTGIASDGIIYFISTATNLEFRFTVN